MDSPLTLTIGSRGTSFLQSSNDYHRERKKLNKKISKLRSELNISTKDTKNYKTKEKISKISKEDYDSNDKFGLVLLYTAERDILYALETKSLMETESSRSKEVFILSKYKKALQSCISLIKLIEDEADLIKKTEVFLYASIVQGYLFILKKNWKSAINALSISKFLSNFLNGSKANFTNKTLILEILENLIDPSLKLSIMRYSGEKNPDLNSYCKKNFSFDKLPSLSSILNEVVQVDSNLIESEDIEPLEYINWRNHKAKLHSEEISRLILKNQSLEKDISMENSSSFDPVLLGWQEILDIHLIELEKNNDEIDSDEIQDNQILLTFINYNLFFNKIKRDLSIINELKQKITNTSSKTQMLESNRDISRLIDTILSTIQQIKELPGVYNDDELNSTLESLEAFYNGLKISLIGDSYYVKNQFKEALVLFSKSSEIISSIKPYEIELSFTTSNDIQTFKETVAEKEKNCHVLTQFEYQLQSEKINSLVIDSVDKFPIGNSKEILSKIATIKPLLNPVSFKPVLFDVAFNYIDYTVAADVAGEVEVTQMGSAAEADDKKRGFFGLFGR